MRCGGWRRKTRLGSIRSEGLPTGFVRASTTPTRPDMHTSALALLLALAGPVDTVRVVPDSAPASVKGRLVLPVSLQIDADTIPRRRRKSVEVSEWYERRLRIHRYGAYA